MDLREEIIQVSCEKIEEANRILRMNDHSSIPQAEFEFSTRVSKVSGCAKARIFDTYPKRTISSPVLRFNLKAAESNREVFLKQTVAHEVAHLMSYVLGSKGHDDVWKDCCRKLGIEPKRCSSYVLEGYIRYTCRCGKTFQITPKMDKKIGLGKEKYTCAKCHGEIYREDPIDKAVMI